MGKLIWLALLLTSLPSTLSAQHPHLAGEIHIDPTRGVINGDMCLSSLPKREAVSFLLHRGLNIKSVRDARGRTLTYEGHADLKPVGVALQYTIKGLPKDAQSFCVSYTGAYPVYGDAPNVFDYQEVIAFDGKTVRAAASTRWYPVAYDPVEELAYEEATYRLRVNCSSCAAVYVNGSAPQRRGQVEVASSRPRPLLLYAGDFAVTQVGDTFFVGEEVPAETARAFVAKVSEITRFYERFLSIPYGDSLVFMRVRPIKALRPGQLWGFFSFPTLGVNVDFERFVQKAGADEEAELNALINQYLWGIFAHETAHYYFGTLLPFRGSYAQFFGESTAEYLALKATQQLVGEKAYRERLHAIYTAALDGPPLTPLDQITKQTPMSTDRYRYKYGPLLLAALEREVGRERMGQILASLVKTPKEQPPDYASLRQAALAIGVPQAVWERFERRCVRTPGENCFKELIAPIQPDK